MAKVNNLALLGAASGATSIFLSIRKHKVDNPFTAKEMAAWSTLLAVASTGIGGLLLIKKF